MRTKRNLVLVAFLCCALTGAWAAAAGQAGQPAAHDHGDQASGAMTAQHEHGSPAPAITFTELEQTAQQLATARQATEKYQDVRVAEAAGYRAIGPDVPGMGIHYVRQADHRTFSITEPPILLYERDAAVPGGLRLVGVSYLFVAPSDASGQPVNPPFPKALASWHKHNNICV